MRKMWTFIFLLIILSLVMIAPKTNDINFNSGKVEFYLSSYYNPELSFATVTKNGSGCIIESDVKFHSQIEDAILNYEGKTFITDGDDKLFEYLKQKLNLKVDETLSENNNIYGFSTYFDKSIYLSGKKINTQMLLKDGKIYIGCPILLGSY